MERVLTQRPNRYGGTGMPVVTVSASEGDRRSEVLPKFGL